MVSRPNAAEEHEEPRLYYRGAARTIISSELQLAMSLLDTYLSLVYSGQVA